MKTGLFGGTFDPIHIGHLIIAETVRSDFVLDRVLFIPAQIPPNKVNRILSAAQIRLKMVELAIDGYSYFDVSDVEIQRGGVSYTVETVHWFKETEEWGKDELFLIVGSDSLLEMKSWKDPGGILQKIQTLVVGRPGFDIEKAEESFRRRVKRVYTPFINISSTEIRQRVRSGKSIHYWVPEKVEVYIRKKGLYLS